MKRCVKCGVEKANEAFPPHKLTKDGLNSWCRECRNEAQRERRRANPEKTRQQKLKYNEENREKNNEYARRYYAEHSEERIAYAREMRKTEAFKHRNWLYNEARCGRFPEGETPELLHQRAWFVEYMRKNRDKRVQKMAAWRDTNRGRFRSYMRTWQRVDRIRNPDRNRIKVQNRKALRRGNGGSYTVEEWQEVKARYNFTCLRCERTEPEIMLTPDHVVPLVRGGRNDIANIQPLCLSCNCSKGARSMTDYRPLHQSTPPRR